MGDIYYQPQNYGLRILDTIEDDSLSYEFDMLVVWQEIESDRLYWARDSGCSCPSPFEGCNAVSDLNYIHDGTIEAFEAAVNALGYGSLTEKGDLIRKVKTALAENFREWVLMERRKAGVVNE